MQTNHIANGGGLRVTGRALASITGMCPECECDEERSEPHEATCTRGREIEDDRIAAEIAKQNAERDPECDCSQQGVEPPTIHDAGCACVPSEVDADYDAFAGVHRFMDPATELKAQLVKGETVYRVYLTSDDESLLVREAEATTEQLARSAAMTLAKARKGERFAVTKETIEHLWAVSAG